MKRASVPGSIPGGTRARKARAGIAEGNNMNFQEGISAMRAKVAGLTVDQLEGVYRELPVREARQEEHRLVSIALGLEYGARLRERLNARSCKVLVAIHKARVDSSGRYKPAAGEPAELVSKWCDVTERLLEERHGVDFYELWEAQGAGGPGSEDTNAYSSHIEAVIASRCNAIKCEHRA